jgi:hypothetical protein
LIPNLTWPHHHNAEPRQTFLSKGSADKRLYQVLTEVEFD